MAKAKAMCKCATCGCTFEVTAYKNNSREARSFEAWAEENVSECKDCRDKRIAAERAEENARAAETAGERGWPVLEGTEKQVAWATTIREQEMSELIEKYKKMLERGSRRSEIYKGRLKAIDHIIRSHVKASWWIDNRGSFQNAVWDVYQDMTEHPDKYAAAEATEAAEAETMEDAQIIAQPETRTHDGVVDIRASEQRVTAEYIKDEDFRTLVKGLGYSWKRDLGKWALNISYKTGTAAERAAELGNRLLNAGFSIRIQDADTLRNAIEGNYAPMTHRWISRDAEGRFFVTWARDDDFYGRARKLPGAKYISPGVAVPAKEYEAIRDFAHTYDFKLSPGAAELMDEMVASTRVVVPAEATRPEYDEHPVADILNTSRDVLDDLKD